MTLVALAVGGAAAQSPNGGAESCRVAVQSFYDWYVPMTNDASRRRRNETADTAAVRLRPQLFDPALVRLLRADSAARSRASDEIVGLDADPFLLAQDLAAAYRVGDVKVTDGGCQATVESADAKVAPYRVVARLRRMPAGWVFVDFVDSEGHGLVDLLKMLAQERRQRK